MDRRENLGIFHANGRQIVDVEEAPVIDFINRNAPEAEPVGFAFEQPFQAVEATRIPSPAVDVSERLLDGFPGLSGLASSNSESLRLTISFSLWRSRILASSISVGPGKWLRAVMMLSISATCSSDAPSFSRSFAAAGSMIMVHVPGASGKGAPYTVTWNSPSLKTI